RDRRCLIGADGRLSWAKVDACPSLKLIHIAGAVDAVGWAARADRVLPAMPRPFGYMSTSPAKLGPRPVLELSAAGLRVGEVAARARRGGASPAEAARRALAEAPAMDFAPPWSWVTEDVRESAHA
ncbi:MAG: hypothetical protein KC620_13875, partial [Myxococcales bacterium]|nr:hypothetical protein [Myxococcales bacterium]